MATLLLRFAAPLQAWGSNSKFEVRRTELFPTKSGVIGLIASALGRKRDADLSDLQKLKIGVRVDDPGQVISDFHTAKSAKASYITTRYYLSDAAFLVGIESEDEVLLNEIMEAVKAPEFPLYLGRRSCPPTLPIVLGIKEHDLVDSLRSENWLVSEFKKKFVNPSSRIIIDAQNPLTGAIIKDDPISFNPEKRQFGVRFIEEIPMEFKADVNSKEHDPFGALEVSL